MDLDTGLEWSDIEEGHHSATRELGRYYLLVHTLTLAREGLGRSCERCRMAEAALAEAIDESVAALAQLEESCEFAEQVELALAGIDRKLIKENL